MKKKYSTLYSKVESILFQYDLMEINFGDNIDEYSPEVDTILPRLKDTNNVNEVAVVIKEEFQHWFKENISFDEKSHQILLDISNEIWIEWLRFSNKTNNT